MKEKSVYWTCIVGPTKQDKLPAFADSPMRKVVSRVFRDVTTHTETVMWSGWGTTQEKADVLNTVGAMEVTDPLFKEIQKLLRSKNYLK